MTHYVRWLELEHNDRSKRYYKGVNNWMYCNGIAAMKLSWWADMCEDNISQQ